MTTIGTAILVFIILFFEVRSITSIFQRYKLRYKENIICFSGM